jgi:hypothetical protein
MRRRYSESDGFFVERFPGAEAYWSTLALNRSTNVVRLRRGVDNQERDFSARELMEEAQSWASGGNARVAILYDQKAPTGNSAVRMPGDAARFQLSSVYNILTGDVTLCCWFKRVRNDQQEMLIQTNSGTSNRMAIQLRSTGGIAFIQRRDSAGSTTFVDTPAGSVPPNGSWRFAVLTKSGGFFRLYLDGQEVINDTYGDTWSYDNTGAWNLGGRAVQDFFLGSMGGVFAYNRGLSVSEINQLFVNGYNHPAVIRSGLIHEYLPQNFNGTTWADTSTSGSTATIVGSNAIRRAHAVTDVLGIDAFQTTSSQQPYIVKSGVLQIGPNGLPKMDFVSADSTHLITPKWQTPLALGQKLFALTAIASASSTTTQETVFGMYLPTGNLRSFRMGFYDDGRIFSQLSPDGTSNVQTPRFSVYDANVNYLLNWYLNLNESTTDTAYRLWLNGFRSARAVGGTSVLSQVFDPDILPAIGAGNGTAPSGFLNGGIQLVVPWRINNVSIQDQMNTYLNRAFKVH